MKERKIDEEHLKVLVKSIEKANEFIAMDINILKNKEADIFVRFMAYQRSVYFALIHAPVMVASKNMLIAGYSLHNPIFKTAEALKNGWGELSVDNCEFFITPESDESGATH